MALVDKDDAFDDEGEELMLNLISLKAPGCIH